MEQEHHQHNAERDRLAADEQAEHDPEGRAPRIYVASLSDYNAGRLHGDWLDATGDTDILMAGIDHMLAASPDPGAEEWAIHDYDGFGSLRLSEFEPLSVVSAIAQGIAAHGPAFAAWADLVDKEPERLQHFGDAYQGTWPTRTAYAEELLDDMGAEDQLDRSVEAWLRPYVHIDYEDFGRDMELGGDYEGKEADDGTLYIFDSRS